MLRYLPATFEILESYKTLASGWQTPHVRNDQLLDRYFGGIIPFEQKVGVRC